MSLTAGSLSAVSVGASNDVLQAAAFTAAGSLPVTYQWYRSTTSGFTPGGGSLIAGATSLTLSDSGLTPGTQYYYKVVGTDSSGTPQTATTTQLAVLTTAAAPGPNQFSQAPYLGQLDQYYNGDTIPCQFDPAGSGTLVAGQAVKFSTAAGGPPQVVPCTAASDVCAGFVNYNSKYAVFSPGDAVEISMAGNVMYLLATAAINRGSFLTSKPAAVAGGTNGGVVTVTGSSGYPIIGYALDTAISGALLRVFIQTPAAPYAID
jgi:hypothetical protein